MDDMDGSAETIQASAREWHRLQLAALGFVGLCGVLKGDAGQGIPLWVQSVSAVLVLAALVVAVAAVLLVLFVAWPVGASPLAAERSSRRVRSGIWLTFIAVALTALSSTSAWWPTDPDDAETIRVTTTRGTACGTVLSSDGGQMDLDVDGQRTRVTLAQVVSIEPVSSC
jgi:hypothetical protein